MTLTWVIIKFRKCRRLNETQNWRFRCCYHRILTQKTRKMSKILIFSICSLFQRVYLSSSCISSLRMKRIKNKMFFRFDAENGPLLNLIIIITILWYVYVHIHIRKVYIFCVTHNSTNVGVGWNVICFAFCTMVCVFFCY